MYKRQELHKGLDIPAPYGTPIQAVMDGVVIESGYSAGGYGNYVIIYHGNGMSTMYAPVSYTHLDVYKRQLLAIAFVAVGLFTGVVASGLSVKRYSHER